MLQDYSSITPQVTVVDFNGKPVNFANTGSSNNSNNSSSYTNSNYSSTITTTNTPQNLAAANSNRDRITIQNLDSTDILLVGIDEDAVSGRSYEIDPRGVGVVEEGEADKRISVMSAKAGLKFVAIARLRL